MTGTSGTLDQLRQVRYRVARRDGMIVKLLQNERMVDVNLNDLSLAGAKLGTSEAVDDLDTAELHIQVPVLSVHLSALATIQRCDSIGGGDYFIGCSFLEDLPESEVGKIAAAGFLERRLEPRRPVSQPVRIHSDANRAEGIPGSIVEYSVDGCRLLLFSPLELGARLLIHFGDGATVSGRVVWQSPCDAGQLVGCTFSDARAYDVIRQRDVDEEPTPVAVPESTPLDVTKLSLQLTPWIWIGFLAVLFWVALRMLVQ